MIIFLLLEKNKLITIGIKSKVELLKKAIGGAHESRSFRRKNLNITLFRVATERNIGLKSKTHLCCNLNFNFKL